MRDPGAAAARNIAPIVVILIFRGYIAKWI